MPVVPIYLNIDDKTYQGIKAGTLELYGLAKNAFRHHYVQVDHDHVFLLHSVLRSSGHFPAYRSQLHQRPGTAPEKKVPQSQIPGS